MSLTVNLKPSGIRPVGSGQLIYQFTESTLSGKTNYRVQLEFNGLSLPLFEFRPDENLVIECDIAPILRSVLALSTDVADRFKNTYVSYQAVWDGGSDSQVDLTGDVIYFYAGSNNPITGRSRSYIKSTDGVALPSYPPASEPSGMSLLHHYPFKDGDNPSASPFTPNSGFHGWVGREFIFECLHDNSLESSCKIYFISPSGSSYNTDFNGSVFGMEQATHVFDQAGQWLVYVAGFPGGDPVMYFYKRINVVEECEGAIQLQWLNDFGGIERRIFEQKHLLQLDPQANSKYLFRTLYDRNLTYEEWLALSELFREGAIYNDERRIGQFVQDITNYDPEDSGEPNVIDVIVTPATSGWQTRQKKTEMAIQVRYPAMENSEIT